MVLVHEFRPVLDLLEQVHVFLFLQPSTHSGTPAAV